MIILLLVFLGDEFHQDFKFHLHDKVQEAAEINPDYRFSKDDCHSSDDCHQPDEFHPFYKFHHGEEP